jgi:hypothetical protein
LGARAPFADIEALAREIDSEPRPTAIVIDEYDRIRLLDAWLRHELLAAQPDRTRWLIAGRFSPRATWLTTPGWSDAVLSLRLDSLDETSCRVLLTRRGVADESMAPMMNLALGNPLALALELELELAIRPHPSSGGTASTPCSTRSHDAASRTSLSICVKRSMRSRSYAARRSPCSTPC